MSPKIRICKESDCNDQATTKGFCRFHYLKDWTHARKRRKKAVDDLNRYVEKVVKNNPGDYLTEISKDLNRWHGHGSDMDKKAKLFDDLQSDDAVDSLIDNLRIDDDY